MTCRICLEEDDLITPCKCSGTTAYVHERCLLRWLSTSGRTNCEICQYEYIFQEVEETKCVVCPVWTCDQQAIVFFFFLVLGVPSVVFMSDMDMEYTFLTANGIFWCMILFHKAEEHILENSVLWKFGFCGGQFLVAYYYMQWFYFEIEFILFVCLLLFVYIHLVCIQSKQVVQYIYTNSDSVNE